MKLTQRLTRALTNYEVVIATVTAVVLVIRLTGGSFTGDIVAPPAEAASAATVTPFTHATRSVATPPDVGVPDASVAPSGSTDVAPGGYRALPSPSGPDGLTVIAQLASPGAVAVAPSGVVWMGTNATAGQPPRVLRLRPDGGVDRAYPLPGSTGGITALVASDAGDVYVLGTAPAAVSLLHAASGTVDAYATIPDVTPCVPTLLVTNCDAGLVDRPPAPTAMAFDAAGSLFVADADQGAIWRVKAGGGRAEQWFVEVGWANPTRPAGPTGLAFDGAGAVVVVVQSLLTEDPGALYLIDVDGRGAPGAVRELTRFDAAARPSGVALARSGRLYIPLRATGRLLVLDPTGKVVGSLPADDPGLGTPVGVAFRGTHVLVVDAGSNGGSGRLVRLPVGEEGGPVRSR